MKISLFNWTAKENIWYPLSDYEVPTWRADMFDMWEFLLVCNKEDYEEGFRLIQTPLRRGTLSFPSNYEDEDMVQVTHFMLVSPPSN